MVDFDEKGGIVPCNTSWGRWWQTIDDVTVEITIPRDTTAKDIQVHTTANTMKVTIKGNIVIEGTLANSVHGQDTIWTIEDKCLLMICLTKVIKTAGSCWRSLLTNQHEADPFVYDQMQRKLTLQRFQFENPGMDFSSADISGNYQNGGPNFS